MRAWPFLLLPLLGCSARHAALPIASDRSTSDATDAGPSDDEPVVIPSVSALPNVDDPGDEPDPSPALVDASVPSSAASADASVGPPFDAGKVCSKALAPGDLAIVEMLVESVAGSGDHGEWIEIESRLDCALDLRGLHGDAPSGARVNTFDVTSDVWIPAKGRFVVADARDAATNHALPGLVLVWLGEPGDVLRNQGTTISIGRDGVLIDAVTYPSAKWTVGTSIAFPADCAPSARGDWSKWTASTATWFPGFYGSPNGPNVGQRCPE